EGEAAEECISDGLANQAGRHADMNSAKGLVAELSREPHLVDLGRAEQQSRQLGEICGERFVQKRLVRERLTLERGTAVKERAPVRIHDRPVHGDPGVTDESVEKRPKTRVVPECGGARGGGGAGGREGPARGAAPARGPPR